MKLQEAIRIADELMPNQYTPAQKIVWLSDLEGQAKREVFDHYENNPAEAFQRYTEETDPDTELLIPEPYAGVYVDWLHAMYTYYNAEFTKHGNAQTRFNNSYLTFQAAWNRTHRRIGPNHFRY